MSATTPRAGYLKQLAHLRHPITVSYDHLKRTLRFASGGSNRKKNVAIILGALLCLQAALTIVVPVTASRKAAKIVTGGPKAVMAANNFRRLQPWEFAAASSQAVGDAGSAVNGDSGGATEARVQFGDGQQYSFPRTPGSVTTIMQGQADVETYVREGDGVTVHGSAPDDPSEKIDGRLKKVKTDDQSEIPVIIRFNLSYKHFYDKADRHAVAQAQKRQEFGNAKNHVASILKGAGRVKHDLLIINGVSAALKPAMLERLADDAMVAKVEPDITARITLDTSVDEIHARETWQLSDGNNNPLTGVGKRIAIIDSGVDYTHPDLGGCLGANCKVLGGWNFLADNGNPMDDNGHGTHVAATAAGKGVLWGVAPDANILAYKVCNSGGSCVSSDIISAIDYATDPNRDGDFTDHVDVASMSLGGFGGNPDDSMSLAVDNSTYAGVIHTIAAGNDGPGAETINSPGTSRMAITVAAACKPEQIGVDGRCANAIASFSSRGPLVWFGEDIQKPDVSAPGVMICAARWQNAFSGSPTCLDNQHVRISGTSMATPHVAGAAALVRQAFPSYDPMQVKQLLKNTARSLNRPYDEQGAGEIDLRAAIPGSNKVIASPNSWEMYSDASVKLTQFDNYFDVAPIDPSISTLSISANIPVPGVSMSFDKTTLNFAGQSSDGFSASVFVDNDVTPTGDYSGSIVLSEGGVTKGIIPLYLHVSPTVGITPSPIVDYGVDNPSLASWTSERTLTITNFRSDISQTLNIAPSSYPAGVTFNSPNSVTIPPEGSVTINTNLFVDNTVTPNGSYSGSLRVFNSTVEKSVTTKFIKFFVLTFNDTNGGDIIGSTAVLHNRIDMQSIFNVTKNPTTIYLDTPGLYDLELYYPARGDASGTHQYTVIKEGISLASGEAAVDVSRDDAIYQLKMEGTTPGGAPVGPLGIRDSWDEYIGKGFGVIRVSSGTNLTTNYFSAVSSSYRHHEIYQARRQAAPALDYYYGGFTGLSSNRTFTNTAADFKSLQLKVELNRDTGTALPLVWTCMPNATTCTASYDLNNTLSVPVTQTINSLLPPNAYQYQNSDSLKIGCPPSGACASAFSTAYFDLATHSRKAFITDTANLPSWDGDVMYNGLGPSVWVAKFSNTTNNVRLLPYYGSTLHTAFMRQDFAFQDYDPVPYVLNKNGAPFASGSLGRVSAISFFFPFLPNFSATAGQYEFRIDSFPYFNRGISLNAKVRATFDTSLPDKNPPALAQLKYTTNGVPSDAHDSNASNQLFFAMDAVGGSLSQVTAGFSGDGNAFTPLTLSAGGGCYTATVPAVPFTKIAIRLTGVDSSNNTLEYTFELPALNPVADTVAPTTSITSPTNGQTVTGIVNVQAIAQDNTGVTRVELYQDGNLIGTSTSAPYTFSWNTNTVSAGSHTLVTRAYDFSNNVGSSAPVNVTVQGDTVLPTTSITSPTAGQIVNGNVVVQVNAQDNVGVTQVELYQDGQLIGTKTSAPYTFNWNTDAVSEGSHTLSSRALDAAGNTGNSAPVTVTVKHDIISPTTSIASPTNGQTVTGVVSVQVNAQDNVGVTKVELYQDNNLIGTKTTAPYTFNWDTDAITNGSHTLVSKAYDASGNTGSSSPVTVTVNHDPVPPTVALTAPADGAILTGTVTVSANASDNKGVAKVEFYRGGVLLGTDTSAPYSIQWNTSTETPGSYTLTAKAYDTSNNTATSAPSNVTVRDSIAPTVNITSPANNATVTRRAIVTIAATATDNIGVTRVEFYVKGVLTCTDTTAAFTCTWTVPNTKGVYTLQAKGYDAAGNVGTSSTVSVTAK
jgi:subtilisin family serine protease